MLKIFLWRLIYHAFCLFKMCGYRGTKELYFAFGGNLDPEVLKRRNISPLSKREHVLSGYELKFNHEIPFRDAGMASIEPSEGKKVYGVIYEIYKIDLLRLDCMEAFFVFQRYIRESMDLFENRKVYCYRTNRPKNGLKPTENYLNKIVRGYKLIQNVPHAYIEDLKKTSTVERFFEKDPPYFLIKNYASMGPLLASIFKRYDKFCVKVFAKLIFKPSFFERRH